MHQLHRSGDQLPPGPLVDRVLLKQAHVSCVGSARDERMMEEIADILWSFKHDDKARPHKRDPAVEAQRALELSGRHPGHDDFFVRWAVAIIPEFDCCTAGASEAIDSCNSTF